MHLLQPDVEHFKEEATEQMSQNLTKLVKRIKDFNFVGESLIEFFRHGQSLKESEMIISWRLCNVSDVKIPATSVTRLKKACSQALHCILVTMDISKVFMNASDNTDTRTSVVKKLPLSLSHSVRPALQFHASSWSFST